MKVIALIDDVDVIKKILEHLDLWETRNHDPPPWLQLRLAAFAARSGLLGLMSARC